MPIREEILSGGNTNQVRKVGNKVFRNGMSGTKAVEQLLHHLKSEGFAYSPQFLKRDEDGGEILSFIDGEMLGDHGFNCDQGLLVEAMHALRQLHDLTEPLRISGHHWAFVYPDVTRHEVICHNDYAPYNLIQKDGQFAGIIDFDLAGPGPRVRDVAYFAYWMCPLSFAAKDLLPATQVELEASCPRLKTICDAYGDIHIIELVEMVEEILTFVSNYDEMEKLFDVETARKLEREGHLTHWSKEAVAFSVNKHRILESYEASGS